MIFVVVVVLQHISGHFKFRIVWVVAVYIIIFSFSSKFIFAHTEEPSAQEKSGASTHFMYPDNHYKYWIYSNNLTDIYFQSININTHHIAYFDKV